MSLITRQYGPDAKGSKLSKLDMDNNLYYLQSIGVSGMTFSANTLTLTNPTGGTIANALIDINADSRWYIPSGSTVEIGSYSQSFIYGDLVVLGTLLLNENSQLVILNGDLVLSGGTLSGSGQTVLVDLPTFGDLITSGTYSGGTLTLSTSNGADVTVNGFFTGSTDVFTTGASYNNGIIYFDTNVSPSAYTVNISSLTGDSNTFLTGVTYDNLTNTITLTDNTNTIFNAYIDSVSGLTVNGTLSATTISGGTFYGDGSNLSGISSNQYTYEIGQYVPSEGGVIFHRYLDGVNENYLVVSMSDLTNSVWSDVNVLNAATSSWNGLSNTNIIATQSPNSAAQLCLNYSVGSVNDWYLPAIDELYLLIQNRFNVNKTLQSNGGTNLLYLNNVMGQNVGYWSSTEATATFNIPILNPPGAMYVNFFTGQIAFQSKLNSLPVRAVRNFSL
jgi:hypothetical protein